MNLPSSNGLGFESPRVSRKASRPLSIIREKPDYESSKDRSQSRERDNNTALTNNTPKINIDAQLQPEMTPKNTETEKSVPNQNQLLNQILNKELKNCEEECLHDLNLNQGLNSTHSKKCSGSSLPETNLKDSSGSTEQKTSLTLSKPERRKAVAPLQHPLLFLSSEFQDIYDSDQITISEIQVEKTSFNHKNSSKNFNKIKCNISKSFNNKNGHDLVDNNIEKNDNEICDVSKDYSGVNSRYVSTIEDSDSTNNRIIEPRGQNINESENVNTNKVSIDNNSRHTDQLLTLEKEKDLSRSKNVSNLQVNLQKFENLDLELDSEQNAWLERVRKSSKLNELPKSKFSGLRRSASSRTSREFINRNNPKTDLSETKYENSKSWLTLQNEKCQNRDFKKNSFDFNESVIQNRVDLSNLSENKSFKLSLLNLNKQNFRSNTGNRIQRRTTLHEMFTRSNSIPQTVDSTPRKVSSLRNFQVKSPSNSLELPLRRISTIDQTDLNLVKDTASKLQLPVRRISTAVWKEKYLDSPSFTFSVTNENSENKSCDLPLTNERKKKINSALRWLKQELINIRIQDQTLARQFLGIRHKMNSIRLAVECEGHRELLDDAEEDIEEIRELSKIVDLPPELFSHFSPLKHIGITRMNISSRRFSTC